MSSRTGLILSAGGEVEMGVWNFVGVIVMVIAAGIVVMIRAKRIAQESVSICDVRSCL